MTLHNTNKAKTSGFTIVELLIVIVVIAILAAISIVAYNGIQARANDTTSETSQKNIITKIEAYHAVEGTYPTTQAQLNGVSESTLNDTGITIATPTASNGKTTIIIQTCSGTGNTASLRVGRWDYGASTPAVAYTTLPAGTTCTTGANMS